MDWVPEIPGWLYTWEADCNRGQIKLLRPRITEAEHFFLLFFEKEEESSLFLFIGRRLRPNDSELPFRWSVSGHLRKK